MDALNQAQEDGVVIGLKGVAAVQPRLDVDLFLLQLPDTFNLFCLALAALQNDPNSSQIMEYYQIAGIHGLPKEPWDGVLFDREDPNNRSAYGYCNHAMLTFPTWHRPYLAMLEQTIYAKMVQIAGTFPAANRQSYLNAVQKSRMPYIDYSRPRAHKNVTIPAVQGNGATTIPWDFSIPQILTVEKIMLRTPTNNALTLSDNPLYTFDFPKVGSIPLNQWTIAGGHYSHVLTQRHPRKLNPVNDLNTTVNQLREAGTLYILNMLTGPAYNQYEAFAANVATQGPSGSLEGLHNQYHGILGGQNGHMSTPPVSAFDPIFWLHHCQVDRFFAIWQAIYPTAWWNDDQAALLPLRSKKSPQQFWNSATSRDIEGFGYTYSDVVGTPSQVRTNFVNHYSWSVRTATKHTFGTPPADMQPLDLSHAQVFQYPAGTAAATAARSLMSAAPLDLMKGLVKDTVDSTAAAVTASVAPESEKGSTLPSHSHTHAHIKAMAAERSFRNTGHAQVPISAPSDVDESKVAREWFVDDVEERMALNGTFTIFYFIGRTPGPSFNASDYLTYPTLAGISHIFAAPMEICDNCGNQQAEGHLITNTSPITPILLDYVQAGELPDLSAPNVKPFLAKNLKWRVIKADGERVDPRTVQSLRFGVSSKLTDKGGNITYQEFPEVISEIIENSSSDTTA